jgi:hypothetical protein
MNYDEMRASYLEKGRQAQMAMWAAVGNVFGFIASAASVIAAVKKEIPGELLFFVLLVSFLGITAVVGCFRAQKKEYIGLYSKTIELEKMTFDQKIEEAKRVSATASPVMIRERAALVLLALSVVLFLFFCWLTFRAE